LKNLFSFLVVIYQIRTISYAFFSEFLYCQKYVLGTRWKIPKSGDIWIPANQFHFHFGSFISQISSNCMKWQYKLLSTFYQQYFFQVLKLVTLLFWNF